VFVFEFICFGNSFRIPYLPLFKVILFKLNHFSVILMSLSKLLEATDK